MKLNDYRLECERCAYLATRNPLHAWAAYGIARQSRREVPEWVLEYFDKVRLGLVLSVPDEIEKRGTAKGLGPPIARALGLVSGGRGNPFDYDTKWWAYGRKVRELMKAGDQLDHARHAAAKFYKVSTSTIIRGAKVYDEVFPEGAVEPEWDDEDEMSMYAELESEGLPPTLPDDDEK